MLLSEYLTQKLVCDIFANILFVLFFLQNFAFRSCEHEQSIPTMLYYKLFLLYPLIHINTLHNQNKPIMVQLFKKHFSQHAICVLMLSLTLSFSFTCSLILCDSPCRTCLFTPDLKSECWGKANS